MTKARFDFIALKTYIEGLLADAVELAKNSDDKVKVYQLCFTNYTLDKLNERLSELEQSIDRGDKI